MRSALKSFSIHIGSHAVTCNSFSTFWARVSVINTVCGSVCVTLPAQPSLAGQRHATTENLNYSYLTMHNFTIR